MLTIWFVFYSIAALILVILGHIVFILVIPLNIAYLWILYMSTIHATYVIMWIHAICSLLFTLFLISTTSIYSNGNPQIFIVYLTNTIAYGIGSLVACIVFTRHVRVAKDFHTSTPIQISQQQRYDMKLRDNENQVVN